MKRSGAALSFLLMACGDPIPLMPEAGEPDAAEEVAMDMDANVGRCDPTAPFKNPVALAELNTSKPDRFPRLSPDELTIYFSTNDSSSSHVFYATRKTPTGAFGLPIQLFQGDMADDWSPSVSTDGLHLWFVRYRYGYVYEGVFESTRMTTMAAWGTPATTDIFPGTKIPDAFVMPDGKVGYWSQPFNAVYEVHRAQLRPSFGPDMMVPGLGIAYAPALSPDDQTIYFSGSGTMVKGQAIFKGTRTDPQSNFGSWAPIAELDSTANDEPGWISADDCVLYFSSNRGGNYDIYVARRGP